MINQWRSTIIICGAAAAISAISREITSRSHPVIALTETPPRAVKNSVSQTDQFRLRMQLLQWRWKVTGLDLPEKLRDQIARELAKKNP
jgi:hypothetical protein